jgi:hypothetical protein
MAWYFLRMPGCDCPATLAVFRRRVGTVGRVHTAKIGTAVDPTAAWFVVNSWAVNMSELREALRVHELSNDVDMVEPIPRPVDGSTLARQLALF